MQAARAARPAGPPCRAGPAQAASSCGRVRGRACAAAASGKSHQCTDSGAPGSSARRRLRYSVSQKKGVKGAMACAPTDARVKLARGYRGLHRRSHLPADPRLHSVMTVCIFWMSRGLGMPMLSGTSTLLCTSSMASRAPPLECCSAGLRLADSEEHVEQARERHAAVGLAAPALEPRAVEAHVHVGQRLNELDLQQPGKQRCALLQSTRARRT